jgi:acyl-CoA dehydrogenase
VAAISSAPTASRRRAIGQKLWAMPDINPRAGEHTEIREAVRAACAPFDSAYWQRIERESAYPDEFVRALTVAGWLAALIPEEFGGGGLSLTEASIILEEINRSGANSGACHAQMYIMGTLLRHGSPAQKARYLPAIASGACRLQSFAVTEPATGTDTTRTRTTAVRRGDRYVVNGQKVWISRVQHSDLMLLLARTTPLEQVTKRSHGLSVFLVDLPDAESRGCACARSRTW